MNITQKWNLFDRIIFKIENGFVWLWEQFIEISEKDVDTELIIDAALKHLEEENRSLKKLQYPGLIICESDKYLCPCCRHKIASELVKTYKIKFCPECGKRIILPAPVDIFYATSHKE